VIKFKAGKRCKAWNKNVVSIGLASGFLEPLESTSIHLIQMGIAHLLTYFPAAGFHDADRDQYNRVMDNEYTWVRDFIILHYHVTNRRGNAGAPDTTTEVQVEDDLVPTVNGAPLFDISLPPAMALQVAVVAAVAGVLAAVAPARRASRMDPAQAIRL
jgi:ABC-type antimicrobial peptide transport system permease subunit